MYGSIVEAGDKKTAQKTLAASSTHTRRSTNSMETRDRISVSMKPRLRRSGQQSANVALRPDFQGGSTSSSSESSSPSSSRDAAS
jgi:hypothetical protein